jgi:hypothetical protein
MTGRFETTCIKGRNSLAPSNSFFKGHRQQPKCDFGEHNESAYEKLFAPKPRMTPQEFASKLLFIVVDKDINRCVQVLNLSGPQKNRYFFSTLIFTLTLPTTLAVSQGRTDLVTFLPRAQDIMLNAQKSEDAVRLGDFVITEHEYMRLMEFLEKRFRQRVSIENIQNYKINFYILLAATALIRGEQQLEDLKEILASSPPEKRHGNQFSESEMWRGAGCKLICKYGMRLESYICEDFCPERILAGDLSRTVTFGRLADQYFKRISAAFKIL